ncbi:MAG: NADP-dependent succinate-semialdehyde dehydrogenase [Sphingomonadales bacterium]
MKLKNPQLLRDQCLIDGAWVGARNGKTFAVINPATAKPLAQVPEMGARETHDAIAAAKRAMPAWAAKTAGERAQILMRWHDLMVKAAPDLAQLITAEQGKPLAEAKGEVLYAASFIQWFAEEARRVYGDIIPGHEADKRIMVLKQPVGVVAAITPWNFPAAMITRKVSPALAAGCAVVIKPAEATPLTALALGHLALRAGIPAGVVNIITGKPAAIGGAMTKSPDVAKLSFTGSTAVGKLLYEQCAGTVKKLSLELGGNAPFIVFDDADLDAAIDGVMASKYRNSGQTCVCANRIFVQDGVFDDFATRLAERVGQLRVGDGLKGETDQGPLINAAGLKKVETLLADAVKKGARVITGGKRHRLGGTFFEPTVVAGVKPNMRIAEEEIFGPVAPLYRFRDEDDAVRMANDTRHGLAAYFYTRDLARSWRVSEALDYGIVGLNTGMISTAVAPFGGVKESGIGREGARYGIEEFVEIKYLCVGGLSH